MASSARSLDTDEKVLQVFVSYLFLLGATLFAGQDFPATARWTGAAGPLTGVAATTLTFLRGSGEGSENSRSILCIFPVLTTAILG